MAGSGSRGARPRAAASLPLASLLESTGPAATPWAEGDNLPWDDPAFSERMLAEHLSQQHDRASRRAATIDRCAGAVPRPTGVRRGRRARPGPGLRPAVSTCIDLARLRIAAATGSTSPLPPIRHARTPVAAEEALDCTFEQADLRQADLGHGYALVLLLFGQVNVFRRPDARDILRRSHAGPGPGRHARPGAADARGRARRRTRRRHLDRRPGAACSPPDRTCCLEERFWDAPSLHPRPTRWHVVHLDTARVERHAMCPPAATDARELDRPAAATVGFGQVQHASLADRRGRPRERRGLFGITAVR